jgi:hypothetical protein
VHARLGLKIVFRRIVLLVGFKLSDKLFEVRVKGGNGSRQGSAPDVDLDLSQESNAIRERIQGE